MTSAVLEIINLSIISQLPDYWEQRDRIALFNFQGQYPKGLRPRGIYCKRPNLPAMEVVLQRLKIPVNLPTLEP